MDSFYKTLASMLTEAGRSFRSTITANAATAGLLLFICVSPASAVTSVTVNSLSATQAVFNVNTTETRSACKYEISTSPSFLPLAYDVDPSLFSQAGLDASNTASEVDRQHRFFVAGKRSAELAFDKKYYSRALLANATHYYRVTCGGDVVTGSFQTANPPLGNAYPELPGFDPAAFGNLAVPTTEGLQNSLCVVDPLTGVCLYRVTRPGEGGQILTGNSFSYAFDPTGSWGIPGPGGRHSTVATIGTSAVGAPLFLSWDEINFQLRGAGANFNPFQPTIDDLRFNMSGTGGGSAIRACISLDGGTTCSSQAVHLAPSGNGSRLSGPSSFPSAPFVGWGRAFGNWDINNRSGTGASTVAGSNTVVAATGSFNVDWRPGVKVLVSGSGCNGNDVCTVATVESSGRLVTAEVTTNTTSNRAWQAFAAGFLITLESGPAISVSASYDYAQSLQTLMGDSVDQQYCSTLSVNDIHTDRYGAPTTTPGVGRLCVFTNGLYLVSDNGDVRLLSAFKMNGSSPSPGVSVTVSTGGAFSSTDPKTFYGATKDGGLYKGVYAGNYAAYQAGHSNNGYLDFKSGEVASDDQVLWTPLILPGSPSDINVQMRADPRFALYDPALFGAAIFEGVIQEVVYYRLSPGGDSPCVFIRYNVVSQRIEQVLSSWADDVHWGGCHVGLLSPGGIQLGTFSFINGNGLPLNGPFQLSVTQVRKNGAWSNNTSLTESRVNKVYGQSPLIVTTALSSVGDNDHGLSDGEPVVIWTQGGQSNAITTGANGSLYAKASWADTSLTATVDSGATTLSIADGSRFSGTVLLRVENELISCTTVLSLAVSGCTRGALQTQQSAHASGALVRQANSFALFVDAQLTIPFSGNPGLNTSTIDRDTFVMDLEACPDGLPSSLTSSMLDDTPGATGRRCNTIRVAGEPRSRRAYWTELALQPGGGILSLQVSGGVGTLKTSVDVSRWMAGQQVTIQGSANSTFNGNFAISSVLGPYLVSVSMPGSPDGPVTDQGLKVRHATEHYEFPFKGDLTDLNSSSLHDSAEGDFMHDLDPSLSTYSEQMVIVRKIKHSETDIELTIMRYWGNTVNCDRHNDLVDVLQHKNGWTATMVPAYGCTGTFGFAGPSDSKWTIGATTLTQSHFDIGPGSDPGTFTLVSGSTASIFNVPFATLASTILSTNSAVELPVFARSPAPLSYSNKVQEYAAFRQFTAPTSEKVWKADFHALNPAFGNAQDSPVGLTNGMLIKSVRGTQYDPSGGTRNVYLVTQMPSGLDRKRIPIVGFSGYHYLGDHSGPGVTLADADAYKFCVAEKPDECRPSSKTGDVFLSLPSADIDPQGNCYTNAWEYNLPCIFSANSMGGWAVQHRINPVDTNASGGRRLTMGLTNPGRHFTFTNWIPSPDAKWGFLSPPWVGGLRNDIFAMKLPPWPTPDNVDRSDFVPFPVHVPAFAPATTARVVFGYAENGAPDDLYCTTRKEACTTAGSPFAWLGEQQQLTSCFSGCTLNIPSIAGRVVYYRIEWMDSTGAVLSRGPLNAVIPAP